MLDIRAPPFHRGVAPQPARSIDVAFTPARREKSLHRPVHLDLRPGPGRVPVTTVASGRAADAGILLNEGDFWRVGYRGRSHLLKDAKGFGYLAYLLRYPFTEVHALDLVAGVAPGQSDETLRGKRTPDRAAARADLGDAGEMVDAQAKAAYRRRLAELRETTEDRKPGGDGARAERGGG